MAEAQEGNIEAVYEGGNNRQDEIQDEPDRNEDNEDVSHENAKILVILQEVNLVIRELETERRTSEEMIARLSGQNEDLTKRLTSIESERDAERLRHIDLESRLDTLEQRAQESTVKFDGVWQKMSRQFEKQVDKLESYKVGIHKDYLEHFAESFETLLAAVEGLDQHVQGIESKYNEQETDLHKVTHRERRKQKGQSTPMYASQVEQTEQKSPLTLKYARHEPKDTYSIAKVLTKAPTAYKERSDSTHQEAGKTPTVPHPATTKI